MEQSMDRGLTPQADPLRVVLMSTYVPRECGIATYAEDVLHAVEPHGAACQVIAMERPGQNYSYDQHVVTTIREDLRREYLAAADAINTGEWDMLSLQHEFGIYGGEESSLLAEFLEAVLIPVVVTFHTIVRDPSPVMRENQRVIARRADGVVVMNRLAVDLLRDIYDVDPRKIHVIPHGAPAPHCERHACIRRDLVPPEHEVIATFGLLTPAKGLEYMIQAMPYIVAERPNAVYYILGITHPVLQQAEGEYYRGTLENLAFDLGIAKNVRFVNQYLLKRELVEYLLATDVYVTPYISMEQITSGTLAYAIGSGCPIVSTPYLHALDFLTEPGRGVLVPEPNPRQLAEGVLSILRNPDLKAEMERNNWEYGQHLYWPRVGYEYLRAFKEAAGWYPIVSS